jgi:hypothetical protein
MFAFTGISARANAVITPGGERHGLDRLGELRQPGHLVIATTFAVTVAASSP